MAMVCTEYGPWPTGSDAHPLFTEHIRASRGGRRSGVGVAGLGAQGSVMHVCLCFSMVSGRLSRPVKSGRLSWEPTSAWDPNA